VKNDGGGSACNAGPALPLGPGTSGRDMRSVLERRSTSHGPSQTLGVGQLTSHRADAIMPVWPRCSAFVSRKDVPYGSRREFGD
jgi:hypothetical protein